MLELHFTPPVVFRAGESWNVISSEKGLYPDIKHLPDIGWVVPHESSALCDVSNARSENFCRVRSL